MPVLKRKCTFRIIEIAGGREIYSQSRSKAIRKLRNLGTAEEVDKWKTQKSPIKQSVWELRGRNKELKKVKNWREFTETVFASEISSVQHDEPEQPENEKVALPASSSMAQAVVVFDDIGDSWEDEESKNSVEEKQKLPLNRSDYHSTDSIESDRVAKVIGSLPIAVYEGSPRRYGVRQSSDQSSHPQLPSAQSLLSSPSVYPPRPGFPQRIICTPNDSEQNSLSDNGFNNQKTNSLSSPSKVPCSTATFDYLYEFSETRKVLEEFFKCPPNDDISLQAEFQDLDYELRLQSSDSGNSYVGQRLAKGLPDQCDFNLRIESPRKFSNSTNLQGYQVIASDIRYLN